MERDLFGGRTALVTGGSGGIGSALPDGPVAHAIVALGITVAINS